MSGRRTGYRHLSRRVRIARHGILTKTEVSAETFVALINDIPIAFPLSPKANCWIDLSIHIGQDSGGISDAEVIIVVWQHGYSFAWVW